MTFISLIKLLAMAITSKYQFKVLKCKAMISDHLINDNI